MPFRQSLPPYNRSWPGSSLRTLTDRPAALPNGTRTVTFEMAWSPPMAEALISYVRGLRSHGLEPFLFDLASVSNAWGQPTAPGSPDEIRRAAARDVQTTQLAHQVIRALAGGLVDPSSLHPKWKDPASTSRRSFFIDSPVPDSRSRRTGCHVQPSRSVKRPVPTHGRRAGPLPGNSRPRWLESLCLIRERF